MMNYLLLWAVILLPTTAFTQSGAKKALDHSDFAIWKTISSYAISPNGQGVCYQVEPGEGDPSLHLYDVPQEETRVFPRGNRASWSSDSRFLVFLISSAEDSLKALRRRKVEKKDLPKDTLAIYANTGELEKIPYVKSFLLPEKWPAWLAYHLESIQPDSTTKGSKKQNEENGSPLVIRNLEENTEDTLHYVTEVIASEEEGAFLAITTGDDQGLEPGLYYFDLQQAGFAPVFTGRGKYSRPAMDRDGGQVAFLADLDTAEAEIRYPQLAFWKKGMDNAELITNATSLELEDGWRISPDENPVFSENGERLFFGLGKVPAIQDTSLLEEEIVEVEVWTWKDAELYPQQKVREEDERKRSYTTVWHPRTRTFVRLASEEIPSVELEDEGNSDIALGYNDQPYIRSVSWEGFPVRNDVYLLDVRLGESRQIARAVRARPRLSPSAQYVAYYIPEDSAHVFYHTATGRKLTLPADEERIWFDETNDRPMDASGYGSAGWLEDDEAILLYDRYDIWKVDPSGETDPVRLTRGREEKTTYRYIQLDPEERSIQPDQKLLLHLFNETTKGSGYAELDLATAEVRELVQSPDHLYDEDVKKAREAERYLFTRESTTEFPDLHLSTDMQTAQKISQVNPQQGEYNWCTKELFEWVDVDGITRQGLVVKPEDFDPNKKYPAIVYFYERNAQNLNRHYHPYPHRSIINFTFYASRGYVIFIPNIWYKEGYPGKSAYDAVMSGTLALLEEGYVDRDRLGIQGHSWGGYQDAYIITQTDLFKCAESGAPVVNMTSAYGGIRWRSGLSRMFQYEHTQSRIGGTLWEYPLRYIENSPLFYLEKVNTPVLILHNDNDGAVPWYQGIEFFVALRRLGKPAWLLNYNGEPHWPVKLQNRKDFQKRMQQFFDHYLMGASRPQWMQRGVPPLEKGIRQGYELMSDPH